METMSPELIQAMLEGLADPAELERIKQQQAIAGSMRDRATSGRATSAVGVLGAGLQGYMAGSQLKGTDEAMLGYGQRRQTRGNKYMDALIDALRRRDRTNDMPSTTPPDYYDENMP